MNHSKRLTNQDKSLMESIHLLNCKLSLTFLKCGQNSSVGITASKPYQTTLDLINNFKNIKTICMIYETWRSAFLNLDEEIIIDKHVVYFSKKTDHTHFSWRALLLVTFILYVKRNLQEQDFTEPKHSGRRTKKQIFAWLFTLRLNESLSIVTLWLTWWPKLMKVCGMFHLITPGRISPNWTLNPPNPQQSPLAATMVLIKNKQL